MKRKFKIKGYSFNLKKDIDKMYNVKKRMDLIINGYIQAKLINNI